MEETCTKRKYGRRFRSLDGAEFTEVFTPMPFITVSSVTSENNSTVYAIDNSWNILKSTNSGTSWAHADVYLSGCSGKKLRIRASKANSNYVLAYSDDDSNGGCANIYKTTDGFATASSTNSAWDPTSLSLAWDATDVNNITIVGNTVTRESTNFFGSYVQRSVTSVTNTGHAFDAFMNTNDSNLVYNVLNGKLYEIDSSGGNKTDITSNLNQSLPAAIEGFPDGSVYVMSRTGELDISNNDAGSFSAYAADP